MNRYLTECHPGRRYSAAALTAALRGCPRTCSSGEVASPRSDPVAWPGKKGRPGKQACPSSATTTPAKANPEPEEALTLSGTPRYGTSEVGAWHG